MVMFAGKLALAPMVRAGELPTRLLALQNGANLVWSPEIVDRKLIQTTRHINEKLNTVDYTIGPPTNENVVFRTHRSLEIEPKRLIFQIGSANPDLAVQASLKVIKDVGGIDLNAGCPKHFSIHSGMGAALLSTPDLLCDILKALVEKVGVPNGKPISCKIRVLDSVDDTVKLVERICGTGITHLTVHCRTRPMRNREQPLWEYMRHIESVCNKFGVSLILNGGIKDKAHFLELRNKLEVSENVGGMIAECAERNPTVFSDSPKEWYLMCKEYVKLAESFENHFGNTKYLLGRMIPGKHKIYQFVTRCRNYEQLDYVLNCLDSATGEILNDPSEYLSQQKELEKKQLQQQQQQSKKNRKRASISVEAAEKEKELTSKKLKRE